VYENWADKHVKQEGGTPRSYHKIESQVTQTSSQTCWTHKWV